MGPETAFLAVQRAISVEKKGISLFKNFILSKDKHSKLEDPAKGQLNSEWIYEVIVSPKMQT